MKKQDYATQEDINAHADTRLDIIDQISFADYDCVLAKTSANLQVFTEQQQHCLSRVFVPTRGHWRQLYLQAPSRHILGTGTQLHGGAEGHAQVQELPPDDTYHAGYEIARIF
jgi:hypothetical protein